jgi:hypothetical protein
MKMNISGAIPRILALVLLAGLSPLYGADNRDSHIEINLIIDGSAAFAQARDGITEWLSGSLIDRCLQAGDRITIWNAGAAAAIVYSDILTDEGGKETVKEVLAGIIPAGDTPDFAGALQAAAARNAAQDAARNITFTLLISASPAALSPVLQGPSARLMRFSRIEEFRGWRAVVIALNIDSLVRQAAAAYFSGT